MKTYKDVN